MKEWNLLRASCPPPFGPCKNMFKITTGYPASRDISASMHVIRSQIFQKTIHAYMDVGSRATHGAVAEVQTVQLKTVIFIFKLLNVITKLQNYVRLYAISGLSAHILRLLRE